MSEQQPSSGRGLSAARAYAHWHIGHSSWADAIIRAYLNPEIAMDELEAERNE